VPLMLREFWRRVAVPALPVIEPVMVLLNVLVPEKVLLFARSVEEAAVMVMSVEPLNAVPLMLREFWRRVAVPALPPMLSEEVETAYVVPPFAPTRPEKVESTGAFVNVCVPPQVLEVVVPNASDIAFTARVSG
jgi:hypothetical protein